uniref:Small nuclear RNA activating complex polypeptide 2 n=1 Tax=Rousettus aegyptiacus TaxID=9407 RepID=A0A7J8BVK0_ROUAE|nr:small nuclear RNA activating complex polypeptide 2 [Rousettus aegyptiacus]
MKPPQRRRAAPARYLGEVTGSVAWSAREKRQLLQLLQARRGQSEPDAAELARELPGRSEAEVLTIAATEPISLLHSKPPKPTQARGKLLLLSAPGGEKVPSPEARGPAPEAPSNNLAGPSAAGDLEVDFEKIYKYLSSISRSCHGPELSAAESAVVLDLLMALPEELPHLPCAALVEHMLDTYESLTAPYTDPSSGSQGPGAEDCGTGSRGQEEALQATPQAPDTAQRGEPKSTWQAAGVCPLNPFLVPLALLGHAAIPEK